MTIFVKNRVSFGLLVYLIGLLALSGCIKKTDSGNSLFDLSNCNQREFVDNLVKFCGQSFAGSQTYIAPGRETWAGKKMTIHFDQCSNGQISIAFWLGRDESRTWLLIEEEGLLRLRHDHRNIDGTPEEVTLYGGYADERGSAIMQVFPADDYTCKLLANACNAEWLIELSEDFSVLSYSLLNYGRLLFKAEFDMASPVIRPLL